MRLNDANTTDRKGKLRMKDGEEESRFSSLNWSSHHKGLIDIDKNSSRQLG